MTNTFKNKKTILVHGPSGSGKDTQVDLLVEKFGFEKIGTGEMFRELMKKDKGIEEMINSGQFIPSELTYELLTEWMKKYDSEKNWIFVSVVRAVDQIQLFDDLLKEYNRDLDAFIHFSLSTEKAIERMSLRKVCSVCGENYHEKYKPEKENNVCDKDGGKLIRRDDDKPEAIQKRLNEYDQSIKPILHEYDSRGLLIDIDASFTIEEIHQEVLRNLVF
jgi:adenylate kinase